VVDVESKNKNSDNPPHWYFPISHREMQKRRMKNIDRALKDMGMTRKDLKKIKIKNKRKGR